MRQFVRYLLLVTVACVLLTPGMAFAAPGCSNEVDYSVPANNDVGVDVNTLLRIRFYNSAEWDMAEGRVGWSEIYNNNALRVTLRKQGTTTNLLTTDSFRAVSFDDLFAVGTRSVPTSTTYTRRYEITPPSPLQGNTTYELVIEKSIRNYDGCNLGAQNKVITFTTGAAPVTPTTIIDKDPAAGATNVLTNISQIFIRFSQQVDSTNGANGVLNTSNFYTSPAVTGTWSYDPGTSLAKIQLGAALTPSTVYTVTLKDVRDTFGNYVKNGGSDVNATPYTWTFTTKSSDTTRPTAAMKAPLTTTSIPVDQSFQIQFSEAMDPASITTSTVYINGVAATLAYNAVDMVATLTPSALLSNATDYTLTVTTGVKDVSQNGMLQNFTYSFTTVQAVAPAPMNDYCQIPPFISGATVKPNVLLMVDNSGSMNEFAYKGAGTNASDTPDTSYQSGSPYYGYFDINKMYTYDNTAGGHFKIDTAAVADKTSFWSGNFLNWLTMRRVDVVRKVLVGGKITPRSLANANYALIHDVPDRDFYKRYNTNSYYVDDGKVYVCLNKTTCSAGTADNTYNGKIYVGENPPDEGIIVKMWDQINFGIMFFNDGNRFEDGQNKVRDGGYVAVDLGSTGTNLVTQVENTNPSTWTPLAEALYEAMHYFMAITGPYNNSNYAAKDPVSNSCQKHFVLILTDGGSTKDRNLPGGKWGTPMTDSTGFNIKTWMDRIATTEGGGYTSRWDYLYNDSSEGSYYLPGVAYWGHVTDLRSATLGRSDVGGRQNVTTYGVFAFDNSAGSAAASDLLKQACKYGGFDDTNSNGSPDAVGEWAKSDGVTPKTYFEAKDGNLLAGEIMKALLDILTRISSGTAASILNNSEGSGASLLQAVFYPRRGFDAGTEVTWIGEMQNLWYYLDPYLQLSSIRVDTVADNKLNLFDDYIAQFYFDTNTNQTLVRLLRDTSGRGTFAIDLGSFSPDDMSNVRSLWRAGRKLWERNLATNNRTIYTRTNDAAFDSSTTGFADFVAADLKNNAAIRTSLQAANATEAGKIIDYIRGTDQAGFRSRAVTIAGANGTWRLGDIVSSTPKIQGNVALNMYNQNSPTGYFDTSYGRFVASNDYKNRGMAYVGANDGMLHAFRMGVLRELTDPCRFPAVDSTPTTCFADKAQISNYTVNPVTGANMNTRATAADDLGREEWAFIPRQMMPYLKYLGDPEYPHLFYVDGTPLIVDVAIRAPQVVDAVAFPACSAANYWECPKQTRYTTVSGVETRNLDADNTSWRTILIGSSGLGGASRNRGGAGKCAGGGTNCVKTPVDGVGYASYFALDITVPTQPKYLWEFYGDPTAGANADAVGGNLGFATTGPVIVRAGSKSKNGRWFAVFASGPTGPIKTTTHQFLGRSDQNLKLFVVDLATGTLIKTIDTGITNAFGGSVSNSAVDNDRNYPSKAGYYQDDAAYIGYVQLDSSTNTWTKGGVVRLVTNESLDPNDATKPWTVSKVIENVGPVTSAVTKLQDRSNGKLWLYFGTGRYFFKDIDGIDDFGGQRHLFGVQEPCYVAAGQKIDPTCTTTVTMADLKDQTSVLTGALPSNFKGWYNLLDDDALNDGFASERVITDPVASPSGVVFYTTFRPTGDVCGFGGNSFIWALDYATGGLPSPNAMRGKLMIQVSTGAFAEVSMQSSFTAKGGKRSGSPIQGVPPKAQGLSLLSNPKPIKKIIHVQEK